VAAERAAINRARSTHGAPAGKLSRSALGQPVGPVQARGLAVIVAVMAFSGLAAGDVAWSRRGPSGGRPGCRRARPAGEAADLAVAQSVVAECEDLAGDRHLGDLAAAALGDPLRSSRAAGRRTGWSSGRPRRAPSAAPPSPGGRCARAGPCRRMSARSAARPGAGVAGGVEALDLADLADHQHRGVAPDPPDVPGSRTRGSALARVSILSAS
jgi:hypothetical protein